MADTKYIGQNYTPPDLVAKVTGRARYAEDFRAEGMLFAKLLTSPMPHCRVRNIDASAALASMLRTRACGIGLRRSLVKSIPSARKSSAQRALPVTFATRSGGV